MKTRITWLGRDLLQGPKLILCTSEREFYAAETSLGVDHEPPWLRNGMPACCHQFDLGNGDCAAIVCIDAELAKEHDPIEVAALLVHEAVHVWQIVEKRYKQHAFGDEGPAFAIQNIAMQLMQAYTRQCLGAK